MSRITIRDTIGTRKLTAGVDMSRDGLAIEHLGTIEDLKGILLLREKEAGAGAMNVDPEKVVKVTEITHGKLTGEGANERLKQSGGASNEDDIIDVQEQIRDRVATA